MTKLKQFREANPKCPECENYLLIKYSGAKETGYACQICFGEWVEEHETKG